MSKQPFIEQLDQAIGRILVDPAAAGIELSSMDASLQELFHIARDLRELPSPDFKARLRAGLERKASMITKMTTKIVEFRPGFRTVTPYLLTSNAEFVDFLKNVFGAVETHRTVTSPASFHAEMQLGDSMLMIGMGAGRTMPTALHIYVPNSDEVFRQALNAGCLELSPMMESRGDRFGCVEDPAGNQLYIATRLGATHIPEGLHSVTTYFHPKGADRFIDFVKRAFSAQEVERHDSAEGEVLHAKIRIGDSVVEVGEPRGWWQPTPSMMYLYVPDCDGLYDQAIRAGAKSIYAPVDHEYGDRSAGVVDEWGNQWYVSTPI